MHPFKMRSVLVTGSRDHDNEPQVWEALDRFRGTDAEILVIHGGARGADNFARRWAVNHCQPHAEFPANWKRYGKNAGGRRNRQMGWTLRPDFVLAFPGPDSIGTYDMLNVAEELGILSETIR